MINAARALYNFFSSFGLPCYEENSVPDDVALPYITYGISTPPWQDDTVISASIWYADTTYENVMKKADEIGAIIESGARVPTEDGGSLWLFKSSPFAQVVPSTVDNVKVVTLNMIMHVLCS